MKRSLPHRDAAPRNPGLADAPKKRRTKAQMEEVRRLEASAKAVKAQKIEEGLSRIARHEDKMEIDDMNAESAHPRTLTEVMKTKNDARKVTLPAAGVRNTQKEKGETRRTTDKAEGRSTTATRPQPRMVQPGRKISLTYYDDDIVMGNEIETKPVAEYQAISVNARTRGNNEAVRLSHEAKNQPRRLERTYALADINDNEVYSNDEAPTEPDNFEDVDGGNGVDDSQEYVDVEDGQEYIDADNSLEYVDNGIEEIDDDPTPKKKRKSDVGGTIRIPDPAIKPSAEMSKELDSKGKTKKKIVVREQVNARRENPVSDGKNIVYDLSDEIEHKPTTRAPKVKKGGFIPGWASGVANDVAESGTSGLHEPTTLRKAPRTIGRMTSTSKAIISSTGGKALKTKNELAYNEEDATTTVLFEESEETERQAALQSPVKGKKRVTNAGIIKIEMGAPPEAPSRPLSKKKEKFTNHDLPDGCHDQCAWRRIFIPTYLSVIGSRVVNESWIIEVSDAMAILRTIWDYTYGDKIKHLVTHDGPVMFIADQRVIEWRSGFGSAALAIVQTFFDDQDWNTQTRQEFATMSLDYHRFLYLYVEESKTGLEEKPRRNGIFRGSFIVQTLSSHLNSIHGALIVPALSNNSNQLCLGDQKRPSVALALSATAVERALTLWRDGNITCESIAEQKAGRRTSFIIKEINKASGKESKDTDFGNANWGKVANRFLLSVKENFVGDSKRDKKFEKIMDDAKVFVKPTRSTQNSGTDPSVMEIGDGTDNECLRDDDSDYCSD